MSFIVDMYVISKTKYEGTPCEIGFRGGRTICIVLADIPVTSQAHQATMAGSMVYTYIQCTVISIAVHLECLLNSRVCIFAAYYVQWPFQLSFNALKTATKWVTDDRASSRLAPLPLTLLRMRLSQSNIDGFSKVSSSSSTVDKSVRC